MSKLQPGATYTLRAVAHLLGLGRGVVTALIDAGYVSPVRGPRTGYRFSFQDIVLLRMAQDIKAARIPARHMLRSLRRLKSKLPHEAPLGGVRFKAIGNAVAVRDAAAHWEDACGQLLLDFDAAPMGGSVSTLALRSSETLGQHAPTAAEWFWRGQQFEAQDPAGAEAAYREALLLAPDHAYAYANLGAMLCETGRCSAAVALFEQAVRNCPASPLLHFNHAIALEDQGRYPEALDGYERCLALDPTLADAHHNAAMLLEKLGDEQAALRHYSACRRLSQ